VNSFSKNEEKYENFGISWGPFFEIKVIKLVTPRPRHFLGCHL
jgi:hypothetical protein